MYVRHRWIRTVIYASLLVLILSVFLSEYLSPHFLPSASIPFPLLISQPFSLLFSPLFFSSLPFSPLLSSFLFFTPLLSSSLLFSHLLSTSLLFYPVRSPFLLTAHLDVECVIELPYHGLEGGVSCLLPDEFLLCLLPLPRT
jgi:hypothetical protein